MEQQFLVEDDLLASVAMFNELRAKKNMYLAKIREHKGNMESLMNGLKLNEHVFRADDNVWMKACFDDDGKFQIRQTRKP